MIVRFLPSALIAYQGALDRLHSLNPAAAYRFMDEIDKACARLVEYPQSGHYIPEYPDRPHRQVIVQRYRIFYCVRGDTLWITGFWHGAQIPAAPELPVGEGEPLR